MCQCGCVCVSSPIFGIYLAPLKELSPESVSKENRCSKNKSKSGNRERERERGETGDKTKHKKE